MFTNIKISNYRCLGSDKTMALERINVLRGRPGSGKSSTMDAFIFVKDALVDGLEQAVSVRYSIKALRRHSTGRPHVMQIELEALIEGQLHSYGFELGGAHHDDYHVIAERALTWHQGKPLVYARHEGRFEGPGGVNPRLEPRALFMTALGGDVRLASLRQLLCSSVVYDLDTRILATPQAASASPMMQARGENWAGALKALLKDQGRKQQLVALLHEATDSITDVRVVAMSGYLSVEFRHSLPGKPWFMAAQESERTLRLAALATALLQEPSPSMIGLSHFESSLHEHYKIPLRNAILFAIESNCKWVI